MASFIEKIQFVFLKLSELLKGRNVGLQNALQINYIFSGGGGLCTLFGSKQCLALPSEEKVKFNSINKITNISFIHKNLFNLLVLVLLNICWNL